MSGVTHGTRTRYVKGCRCAACTKANRDYNRANDSNGPRDSSGVIATLRNLTTGECESLTAPGFLTDAIRDICEECDSRDGDWRIQSLSTQRTILADLVGRPMISNTGRARFPEGIVLGRVGRKDLLAPELEPAGL